MRPFTLLLAAGALCAGTLPLAGQAPAERPAERAAVGTLTAPEALAAFQGSADNFGRRVDGDGSLMIVADDLTASVLNVDSVSFEATNLLAGLTIPDFTGVLDVALEGDNAVVFVERSNGEAGGLLYRFRRVDLLGDIVWLAAGSADPVVDGGIPGVFDFFTGDVEILEGAVIAAFSYWDGPSPFSAGSYLASYALDGTNQLSVVVPAQFVDNALFRSLALGRSTSILIGAPDEILVAISTESDLVLVYAASESLAYLVNFSGAVGGVGSGFGASVAIGGGELFVGEPTNSSAAPNGGAVRVFDTFLGPDLGTLTSSTPAANDNFGRSLALSPDGTLLAIGERNSDAIPSAVDTGYVRLADRSGATLTLRDDTFGFGAPASGPDENFGADMAWADDGSLFLGAPGTTTLDGYVAWFFYDKAFPWMETNQSPALAGTGGLAPELRLEGAAFTDGPLVIGVRDALPGSICFAIIGLSTLNLPAKGGTVYPSLTILKTFPVNAQGQFMVPTTWTADLSSVGPIDLFFQFWVQDPGGPAGFSASDGGVIHHY